MHCDFCPITIGLCGGSASGKTTFARALADELSDFGPVILNQDRYFRDWSVYPAEEREAVRTANHPRAVLWPAFTEHVERLVDRRPIQVPAAGTRAQNRGDAPQTVQPGDVLIVEGHLVFCDEALRNMMEIKIFIDADPHERVLRRMLRDTAQGRTDLEAAVAWYRRDVMPNFPIYTEPTRRFADLVVPFDTSGSTAIRFVASGVREMLRVRKAGDGR